MDQEIIRRFDAKREHLRQVFKAEHPSTYGDIVRALIEAISDDGRDSTFYPDPDRITVIDHGDYQGSQLFVIAAKGYQPSTYWATECSYGSCSSCDTLAAIRGIAYDEIPTDEQANDYVTLALHLAQRMEKLFRPEAAGKETPK